MFEERRQRIRRYRTQTADRRAGHREGEILNRSGLGIERRDLLWRELPGGQFLADLGQLRGADAAGNALSTRLGLKELQTRKGLLGQVRLRSIDDDAAAEHQVPDAKVVDVHL